ncbi:hypothetical protein CMUS01_04008 [Colletotrichum musicola]|uniref:Secreted protein n=1 Tax=Colletotrichum musicola TaxID=2175873 RepID=A0A8H6NPI7_9PEZI|nr:hypothetical protein CMUS01_04008 [Colletotrichum musicola]
MLIAGTLLAGPWGLRRCILLLLLCLLEAWLACGEATNGRWRTTTPMSTTGQWAGYDRMGWGQGSRGRHDGATREVRRRDADVTADADSGSDSLILSLFLIRFDADAHGPALALASRHSPYRQ